MGSWRVIGRVMRTDRDDEHVDWGIAWASAAFVLLIVFGLAVRCWVWVAAVIGVLVLGAVLLWLAFYAARRVDERYEARAALVAGADQQHTWVLAGDDRGIYGDYPPPSNCRSPKQTHAIDPPNDRGRSAQHAIPSLTSTGVVTD